MHRIAGKYDVIRELGTGLTGSVYLVQHVDLKVQYALKLLSKLNSIHSPLIERFKNEAEILLKFTHPGTVQLRDFGKTNGGLYYMAMDYCHGTILTDLLAQRKHFPVEEALLILEQLLDVLEAARKIGLVHRDIKPDNIIVLPGTGPVPKIKVLDFGIASLREELGKDGKNNGTATIVGTPEYMAPEQISAEQELDHRVDIYAAGVLLYELLSGRVPFAHENVATTLLMHLIQPPESMDAALNVPFLVESIAATAMKKERQDRYQTAAEFKKACQEARALLASGAGSSGKKSNVRADSSEDTSTSSPIPLANYGVKILCLDDDEMVINILEHLLEKEGFKVFSATSFSKIHSYIFDNKVDLLISDVNMPGLSGGKVCKMLKASVPDLKVMLFSNNPERELEKLAEEVKADGWMSKFSKPDQWVREISKLVRAK